MNTDIHWRDNVELAAAYELGRLDQAVEQARNNQLKVRLTKEQIETVRKNNPTLLKRLQDNGSIITRV